MRALYRFFLALLVPFFFIRLLWKSRRDVRLRQHWSERLGVYDPPLPRGALWIHAVSVGETRATVPLVRALQQAYPGRALVMTHMTATGRAMGEQLFSGAVRNVYLPYDTTRAVRRFLRHLDPAIGLLMETELWPTLIEECVEAEVPIALINARLSERSQRGYQKIRALTEPTLKRLSFIAAQTEADGARLLQLGAERLTVTGNLKFEAASEIPDPAQMEALTALIGQRQVFLWASTREGEEELLLKAWAEEPVPGALIVLVPRHPNRFNAVADLLEIKKINYIRRSECSLSSGPLDTSIRLVLGDSMGEMALWYALADLAFIGGSLLPLGGQNFLEALAQGCPVLVGPHTFNFMEAARAAQAIGVVEEINDARALMARARELLKDRDTLSERGTRGQTFVTQHCGAAQRTLALIAPWIKS